MKKLFAIVAVMALCFAGNLYSQQSLVVKFKNIKSIEKLSDRTLAALKLKPAFKNFLNLNKNQRILSNQSNNQLEELASYFIVNTYSDALYRELLNLKQQGIIESINENYRYKIEQLKKSNDTEIESQWGLNQIEAYEAWGISAGENIIIGMVDTGIEYNHPDLKDNIKINTLEDLNKNGSFEPWSKDEIKGGLSGDFDGIDNDGNGFADDVVGYDFVDQWIANVGESSEIDPIPNDEAGHGTNVAGVMVATYNNSKGIAGLAYRSKLITAKAFDATGNAESDDIANAIVYCAMNGAKVINFSFGDYYDSPIMHSAIKFAYSMGCVLVASSGNESKGNAHYPSDYSECIAVGGSTRKNIRWANSNYSNNLALIAPSENVLTCSTGFTYDYKSGTSLAAPYVTASAALVLSKYADLKPEEVKGILVQNASVVDDGHWNEFYGFGILNIYEALNNPGAGNISINSPADKSKFYSSNTSEIVVNGSVMVPLFESYQIKLSKNTKKKDWFYQSELFTKQVNNSEIARINLNGLQDTSYILSIFINLKNKRILEKRIEFELINDINKLSISELKSNNVYSGFERGILLTFKTNNNSYAFAEVYDGQNRVCRIDETEESSRNHQIYISKDLIPEKKYNAKVYALYSGIDSILAEIEIIRDSEGFVLSSFIQKPWNLGMGYIYPNALDINSNGKNDILYNDLSSLSIGRTIAAEFDNNKFNGLDTLTQSWIPAGYGDSNGDRIKDLLAFEYDRTLVMQGQSNSTLPFDNIIWDSQLNTRLWAEYYFDIDKDGRDEIIGYNDSAYVVMKYESGTYKVHALAMPDKNERGIIVRSSALADFDGDGNYELAFCDNLGKIFVMEYKNGVFSQEWTDKVNTYETQAFLQAADIDGDGVKDLVQMYFGITGAGIDISKQVWVVRFIKSNNFNSYEAKSSEMFYGVRAGAISRLKVFYRNGLSAADIDNKPGDEIVLATMPYLYALKFDKDNNKFLPMWCYPASFSNSACIADFDKNGKKEIGFNSFNGIVFWEYNSDRAVPKPPVIYDYYATSNSSAKIFWTNIQNASSYKIYGYKYNSSTGNPQIIPLGITTNNNVELQNLEYGYFYKLFVVSVENDNESVLSEPIDVFINEQIKPMIAEQLNSKSIKINCSGEISSIVRLSDVEVKNINKDQLLSPELVLYNSPNTFVLRFKGKLDNADYKIHFKSFRDKYNNFTKDTTLELRINEENIEEIYLKSLKVSSSTLLHLEFSEPVDTSANLIENYELYPFGNIVSVALVPSQENKVDINLAYSNGLNGRGFTYSLTAKNIKSVSGKPITEGAGNTLSFVISENNLEKAYVYPNPISLEKHKDAFVANLSSKVNVKILTNDGIELRELTESDGNGGVRWDLLDKDGNKLQYGVYLIKLKDKDTNEEKLIKFMIVP